MSSFENLEVWQRSKNLAVLVLKEIGRSNNFALRDQLSRSAISIPSNIAEGSERSGSKEFRNFLSYAAGSCAELITQIQIAQALSEFNLGLSEQAIDEARQIGKMIYGLRRSIPAS